jgi:hypothetical protein
VHLHDISTIDEGTAAPGGSSENGTAAVTESTTTTTVTPVSTGPNAGGGFGFGSLDISSTSTGTLVGEDAERVGSSVGSVTIFGVGIADAAYSLGDEEGSGSGSSTGTATGGGLI